MQLLIDPKIFEQHHDFKLGLILIKQFDNNLRISAIHSLLRGIAAQRGREYAIKDVDADPAVRAWHQAYGKFGVNPLNHHPVIENLFKIVQEGVEVPTKNSLIDLQSYFTLKYRLPAFSVDLDWLCGDLKLTFTKGKEPFRPQNSIQVDRCNEGEAAYLDDGGVIARYWNHAYCERAKIRKKTVNAGLFVEDLTKMHMDEFGETLREMQNAIIKYIGGQIEPYILSEENPEIDLGIQGRTHVDDGKIPPQERAHFLEMQKQKLNPSQA